MRKKYRIAYILTSVSYGGLEKVSSCFLDSYNNEKFEILPVVFLRPWQKENAFLAKLDQYNIPFAIVASALYPPDIKKDVFKVFRRYRELYLLLKNGSFDLIHSNGTLADLTSIPIARVLHIPCISTCHGFIDNSLKLKLHNLFNRLVLRRCNKIIAVSEDLGNQLIRSGIRESLIRVIPNAVSTSHDGDFLQSNRTAMRKRLDIKMNDQVVGYIGRLSKEKGCEYLLAAVREMKELALPVKALIIGEGPQKFILQDIAKEYDIEPQVIFLGFQHEIEKWLPVLDYFVLPSLSEGTPMALLEAMSFGIPVIASRVGGVPKIIESGKNGILVSPGKPDEIANVISYLMQHELKRRMVADEGKNTIRAEYNVDNWVRKIESEYLEIVEKSAS